MSILSHRPMGWLLISVLFFALHPSICAADAPPTLDSLLQQTLVNNGQIQESAADIAIARAQLAQAKAALFPHGSATVLAAPMFQITGNPSQSTSDWSHWGAYLDGQAQLVQPIYSFGQLGNYRRAAESQIEARTQQTEMKKSDVIAQAKEFYYGYEMANDLDNLVTDLVKFLDDAVNSAEKQQKKKKKSSIKPHDIFKLKTALEDLKQKKLQAEAAKLTATRAVAWVTGATFTSLPSHPIHPEPYTSHTLEEYLAMAKMDRPELKALAAGEEARAALRDAKKAQSYPVLFIGGFIDGAYTTSTTAQPSTFAYDPFNHVWGGAGVGLKLDLEFWRHSAEAAEQDAELLKLKATESYAGPGIDLQVKKAFWELQQAADGLKIAKDRKALDEHWFLSSAMGWSIGLTPPKDLLEALEGRGLADMNYIQTVYALNMALAHMTQAVGKEVTNLKYGASAR